MFVMSKRNIILPSPDGTASVRLVRDFIGEIPEWAAQTEYYRALVADGKIVPTSKSDKDIQKADEKKVKTRRGKETAQE